MGLFRGKVGMSPGLGLGVRKGGWKKGLNGRNGRAARVRFGLLDLAG